MPGSIPDVDVRLEDGALGLIDTSSTKTTAKVGVASGGTPGRVYAFNDRETLQATLVGGPVTEAAADTLAEEGGTVLVVPTPASVASTISAVVRTGSPSGPTTPTLSVAGPAKDAFEVTVEVIQSGALGTGSFSVSIDGGDNFSPETATPIGGAYSVDGTGLTLTFGTGVYTAGDRYTFSTTAPGFSATDLFGAFDALLADARRWKLLHVVGSPSTGSDGDRAAGGAAIAAATAVKMAEAQKQKRYSRAIVEAPDVADAALVTAYGTIVDPRVAVAAGAIEHLSALSGKIQRRSAAWPIATRAAKVPISEDLAWVGAGPLPASVRSLYRDERRTPALDAARFLTLRTFVGRAGFYVTNPRTLAGKTSDYSLLQNGLVIDEVCAAAYDAMLPYLSGKIPVDAQTGRVDPIFAKAADDRIVGTVGAAVLQPGHVTALSVLMNRTDNLLSTRKLRWKVRAVPYAYPKEIEVEIGFVNPALSTIPVL